MPKVKIDKNKFLRYEKVRRSGVTNMFDWVKVGQLARLTKNEVTEIMYSYKKYKAEWLKEEA